MHWRALADEASASAGHKCFEIVNDDHISQCHGSDSHVAATESDTKCHSYFSSFSTLDEANCPLGCVFVKKPKFSKIIHPHPADIKLPGWKPARSGACRKIVPGSCPSSPDGVCRKSPNGKYGKSPGNPMNKDPLYGGMTQAECAAACVAEPTCFAYHHGAGPRSTPQTTAFTRSPQPRAERCPCATLVLSSWAQHSCARSRG